jgi:hypothetical protein
MHEPEILVQYRDYMFLWDRVFQRRTWLRNSILLDIFAQLQSQLDRMFLEDKVSQPSQSTLLDTHILHRRALYMSAMKGLMWRHICQQGRA